MDNMNQYQQRYLQLIEMLNDDDDTKDIFV